MNWLRRAGGGLAAAATDRMNETELPVCACALLWQDQEYNGLPVPTPHPSSWHKLQNPLEFPE